MRNRRPRTLALVFMLALISAGAYMYDRVHNATMPNQAVLQPPTYASNVKGTSKQQLKIDVVRALFQSWFGPLN